MALAADFTDAVAPGGHLLLAGLLTTQEPAVRAAYRTAGFLAARGAAGVSVLVKALDALQGERYVQLAEARPANEAFLYGWLAGRIGL